MDDLIAKLHEAIDETEQWAIAASRPYEYADDGSAAPEGGAHWQWVAGEDWEPVTPNPMLDEFVADPGYSCNLITVETWPVTSLISSVTGETRTSQRPQSYANSIVEFDSAAAGHIVRHDPARVLRQVAAHRNLIATYEAHAGRARELEGEAGSNGELSADGKRVLANLTEGIAAGLELAVRALAEGYGIAIEEKA